MSTVYTTTVLRFNSAAGGSYTVPAGKKLIVRNVDVLAVNPPANATWYVTVAGVIHFGGEFVGTPYATGHWEGRAVAAAGEVVALNTGASMFGHITGYLMNAP